MFVGSTIHCRYNTMWSLKCASAVAVILLSLVVVNGKCLEFWNT